MIIVSGDCNISVEEALTVIVIMSEGFRASELFPMEMVVIRACKDSE